MLTVGRASRAKIWSKPEMQHANLQPLAGQVAMVTGGGRGLGQAYAIALANAGAAVAVSARTATEIQKVQRTIEQLGGRALAVTVDVTDKSAVAHLVATVEQQLGRVDLLVNCAGVLRAIGRVSEIDADEWWREVEINVRGPFLCSQAVLPGMIKRQHGRIINLASVGGLQAVDSFSAYGLGKTALIRLSESLALENRGHGIVVFAIHPGNVRTTMTESLHNSEVVAQRAPRMQATWRQLFAEKQDTLMERSVAFVLQLATGRADSLSGRYIDVEEDLTELLRCASEIDNKDLYTLRLRRLNEV
jgi:NAD(P)-dependent dehydrogenase (short-subunit alcohol dehydrogenase family)